MDKEVGDNYEKLCDVNYGRPQSKKWEIYLNQSGHRHQHAHHSHCESWCLLLDESEKMKMKNVSFKLLNFN